ncbi:Inosine-5'-monophosphate dehydrogenase [archaeon HR01]|nr:Inosine-5'-monophosphate dehydrogenase [archaeon HR01]
MTEDFKWVYDDEPLTKVLGIFTETGEDVVVVVDRGSGQMVGVINKKLIIKPRLNPTNLLARTVIQKPPRITPDTEIPEAARLMLESGLRSAPIVSDGKPVGIVRALDLVDAMADLLNDVRVADVMTRDPITVGAGETIGKAVSLMRDNGVSRLPVVDGGRLVGIVTVQDIVEKLVKPRERISRGDLIGEKVATLGNSVSSIMSRHVYTTNPSESLLSAVERMKTQRVTSLVVTDRNRVVGILTVMDALGPVAAKAKKGGEALNIQVSYKLPSIDVDDKERVMEVVQQFIRRFGRSIGAGTLSLYFKAHKEKHGDMHMIHCRARLKTDRYQFVGVGEAWRADFAARSALERIERQFLVRRELAARYPYADELLDTLTGGY